MAHSYTTGQAEESAADLRRRAEDAWHLRTVEPDPEATPDQMRHLVVELQVHQIELEMQIEELRRVLPEQGISARMQADPAMRAGEIHYRALFDHSLNGIVMVDPETNAIVAANPEACRLLGYSEAELRTLDRTAIMGTDDSYRAAAIEARECTGVFHDEVACRRADGTWFPVEAGYSLFAGPDGRMVASVCFSDITERKHAEAALRESEAMYRLLFKNMEEGFAVHAIITDETGEVIDFRFLDTNSAYDRHTGLKGSEVIGKTMLEVMPQADRSQIEAYGQVALTGEPLAFDYYSNTFARHLHVRAFSPQPGRFATIFEDITDRKQAEQAFKNLAAIVESSDDAIISIDLAGNVVSWNQGAEKLYGYTAAETIGQHLPRLIAPDQVDDFVQTLATIQRGETVRRSDTTRLAKDGRTIHVSVTISPVKNTTGQIIGLSSIAHDITERKLLQEALRIQRDVSHALSASDDTRQALALILDAALGMEGVDCGGIYLVDPSGALDLVVHRGLSPAFVKTAAHYAPDTPQARLPRDGQVRFGTYQSMPAQPVAAGDREGLHALAVIPVLDQGQLLAVLNLALHTHDDIPANTRSTLEMLALHVGGAVRRLRADDALRESEARWHFALEGAGDGVWDWDARSNQVFFSRQWKAMFGYAEDEIGNTLNEWDSRVHPEDRPHCYADLARHVAGETPVYQNEHRVLCKDGTYKWILDRGKVIEWADDGKPRRVIGTHTDIAERRQAEEALRIQHDLDRDLSASDDIHRAFELILDGALRLESIDSGGIYLADSNGALDLIVHRGLSPQFVKSVSHYGPDTPNTRVTRQGQVLYGNYASIDPTADDREGLRALAVIPVLHQGQLLAVLNLTSHTHDDIPTYTRGTLEALALHIGSAVQRLRAEDTVRKNRQNLRTLFNAIDDFLFVLDGTGHIVQFNPVVRHRLGYTAEELAGQDVLMVHPAARRTEAAAIVASMLAGECDSCPVPLQAKDGTLIPVETRAVLAKWDDKPAIFGVSRDITERKRLEEALQASEARLKAIVENTDGMIWSLDREYRLLASNRSYDRMMARFVGRPLALGDCVLADTAPANANAFAQANYDRGLAGETFVVTVESRLLRPGGTLEYSLAPIYDAQGGVTGVTCLARDVTQRMQAETRVRAALQRLKLATGAASIGIWTWNFADGSLEWDNQTCDLFAVPATVREQGIDYGFWRRHVHPDDLAVVEAKLTDVVRIGADLETIYRAILPDGQIRHIQSSSVIEHDGSGTPLRMVGINRDVTDRIAYERLLKDTNAELEQRVAERTAQLAAALEELKKAAQLKDEFMAAVSHELRTPLAGVLGMAEALELQFSGPLNERQARYVQGILTGGHRLLSMVNSILHYTALLGGRVRVAQEPCRLGELGAVALRTVGARATQKGQTVTFDIDPVEPVVVSDSNGIIQVLQRLLDNAVKFTPDGGRFGLEIDRGPTPDLVHLVVWDTGIGISGEQQAVIFQPFIQGDASLARRYEGIGLGLAYAWRMVEMLGGAITLESTPGEGSRFTVTLPTTPGKLAPST